MANTDIHTGNVDDNASHDRTYHGNGCTNEWDTTAQYYGGSSVSCITDIANTFDGEPLSIGTYYTFQAATAGAGGSIEADNTNSSDTFCPLGWQLPYSGKGGDYYDKPKSWNYLFGRYSFESNQEKSEKIRSYPMSNFYSGMFHFIYGVLFYLEKNGIYWSMTSFTPGGSYWLTLWDAGADPSSTAPKATASAVRCDFDISILEKFSMASAFTH